MKNNIKNYNSYVPFQLGEHYRGQGISFSLLSPLSLPLFILEKILKDKQIIHPREFVLTKVAIWERKFKENRKMTLKTCIPCKLRPNKKHTYEL